MRHVSTLVMVAALLATNLLTYLCSARYTDHRLTVALREARNLEFESYTQFQHARRQRDLLRREQVQAQNTIAVSASYQRDRDRRTNQQNKAGR